MPINIKELSKIILAASLDQLAALTLYEVEDLPGGDDGVGSVAAALVQATLRAGGSLRWGPRIVLLSDGESIDGAALAERGAASSACARTLARVALVGGAAAAARVVWGICGGDSMQLYAERAVWVAGPAGLAIWGGTSRRSEMTGWESSVQVEAWDKVLERLEEDGL